MRIWKLTIGFDGQSHVATMHVAVADDTIEGQQVGIDVLTGRAALTQEQLNAQFAPGTPTSARLLGYEEIPHVNMP
jgi:hypothetical protein